MRKLYFISTLIIFLYACEQDRNESINDIKMLDTTWLKYSGYIPFPEQNAEWHTLIQKGIYNPDITSPPEWGANEMIDYNNKSLVSD
jgi:hypothetical protein